MRISGRSAVCHIKREIVKSYEFQQFGVYFPIFAPLLGVLLPLPAVAPEFGAGFGQCGVLHSGSMAPPLVGGTLVS